MTSRMPSLFVLVNSVLSLVFLLAHYEGFLRQIYPWGILSLVWSCAFIVLSIGSVRRLLNPLPLTQTAPLRRTQWAILVVHTALVLAWFGWSDYQESLSNPGGWMQTVIFQYLVEAPCFAATILIDELWRVMFGRTRNVVWWYVDFAIIGGTFYASLPIILRVRRSGTSLHTT